MSGNRRKRLRKERRIRIFWSALLIIGIASYVSLRTADSWHDYWLDRRQKSDIARVDRDGKKNTKTYLSEFYHQKEASKVVDPFANEGQSDGTANKNSVDVARSLLKPIATISIPAIKEVLPVYGNDDPVTLDYGPGLVPSTGNLLGGKGKNVAIAGHSGKSDSRLFTGLLDIKKGAKFFIRVNGAIHAYKIDQRKSVDPKKFKHLYVNPTKEYVTLITCAPLYQNSERLLVRGHRVKYVAKDNTGEAGGLTPLGRLVIQALRSLAEILVLLLAVHELVKWGSRFVTYLGRRHREKHQQQ